MLDLSVCLLTKISVTTQSFQSIGRKKKFTCLQLYRCNSSSSCNFQYCRILHITSSTCKSIRKKAEILDRIASKCRLFCEFKLPQLFNLTLWSWSSNDFERWGTERFWRVTLIKHSQLSLQKRAFILNHNADICKIFLKSTFFNGHVIRSSRYAEWANKTIYWT